MSTPSTYPPLDLPNTDIWGLLFERPGRLFPDERKIFIDARTSHALSFGSLKQTASIFGSYLQQYQSWQKNDVLAFFTPNSIDMAPLVWGCHHAGGVVTTANPAYTANELEFQLRNSEAQALITHESCVDIAKKAAKGAGIAANRVWLLGIWNGQRRADGVQYVHEIMKAVSSEQLQERARATFDDLAFLVYSSGTTGLPKGVMLSHGNIIANILQLSHEAQAITSNNDLEISPNPMVAFLPFYHIYGLTRSLHDAVYHGATTIVMPRFDVGLFCAVVQKYRAVFAHVVPPVLILLANDPIVRDYDLSSLQMFSCGAAPLSWDLTQKVYSRIKVPIKQAYGLSETSPTSHSQEWKDWNVYPGSAGKLMANSEAKYIDPEGNVLGLGQTGEICIKGPNVFQGYWKNAEATARSFDDKGFFKTGDIGHEDRQGNIFITDRAKELIKYKGFQVAPAELEGLLNTHPRVKDAAVIGVYREDIASEVPRAYLVVDGDEMREEERLVTAAEIQEWMGTRVAHYKKLRGGVVFVEAFPKSPSGKILRRVLRDTAKATDRQTRGRL